MTMTKFNDIQSIKRHLFAFRNGIIADTLRRGGSPYKIIFGLNLPQIKEVAAAIGKNRIIADTLWNNVSTRESRLIAPMIFPEEEMTIHLALEWIASTTDRETIDMLCHNLLRKLPFADELITRLAADESDTNRYTAMRLMLAFANQNPQKASELAEQELTRQCDMTKPLAMQIIDRVSNIE